MTNGSSTRASTPSSSSSRRWSTTYETDGNPVTAWVRAEGKHYIVKLERTGDESGTVEFSDYDEPVETEAPAEDEVVDLSELG